MRNSSSHAANSANACTDPIVGAILSGWRYDISSISPEMRTDYEQHLNECPNCRNRRAKARFFDFLLLSATTLSMAAFLLAAVVLHRIEMLTHITEVHASICTTPPMAISLEVIALAGLLVFHAARHSGRHRHTHSRHRHRCRPAAHPRPPRAFRPPPRLAPAHGPRPPNRDPPSRPRHR